MNFAYKCYLQRIFSMLPGGELINYYFQRNVTKRLPLSDADFILKTKSAYEHHLKFKKYYSGGGGACYYEFGTGWDFIIPISMSFLKYDKVLCADIRRLARSELINDTIEKFKKNKKKIPFDYGEIRSPEINGMNLTGVLKEYFNIHYIAPLDARSTNLPDDSIGFVSSSLTLEHIPKDDILPILNECYRIMKRGAVLSSIIDYIDHWSSFDKNISVYNFLKFSDRKWRRYNPSLHYQNRLRHKDYLDILKKTKFELIEENPKMPSAEDIKILSKIRLDAKYMEKYTVEELGIRESHIVLKKR